MIRRRLVVVPTRASAELLRQTIEARLLRADGAATLLPDLVTRDEWLLRLHAASGLPRWAGRLERELLMHRGARHAERRLGGAPFALRPALVAAMLDFYDELRRRQRTVRRFARALFDELRVERDTDRGSESLITQTTFLAFAYLAYQRELAAVGAVDEHVLRTALLTVRPPLPFDHVVVAVADHPADPRGLWPSDFELLSRLDAIRRLDVVVTDEIHDAGFRDRVEHELPGIVEEIADRDSAPNSPAIVPPPARAPEAPPVFVSRDREEELRDVVRAIRSRADHGRLDSRTAVVFHRPLPYLYLAPRVFEAGGVPCEVWEALPLAIEPYAARLDALIEALESGGPQADRAADQIEALIRALRAVDLRPVPSDAWHERERHARANVLAVLLELVDACRRADEPARDPGELAVMLRHAIESRTFLPPRTARHAPEPGVPLVDAMAARFADVDHVHLVGLVDTDWSDGGRRNIFYTTGLLKNLGWPQEADRRHAHQAAFRDLLGLGLQSTTLHAFQLEADATVGLSPLVDAARGLSEIPEAASMSPPFRFPEEVLSDAAVDPSAIVPPTSAARQWLELRRQRPPLTDPAYAGQAGPQPSRAYRVSRVERYVTCPFKYFAESVLDLSEERQDADGLTPLERGSLIHDLFQRFFSAWHAAGHRNITPETLPEALDRFARLADEVLAPLPPADRVLERTRVLGSIVATGLAERVFQLEADTDDVVVDRLVEVPIRGMFSFPGGDGTAAVPISIRGQADRIDVLAGRRLRVVDYKLGRLPDLDTALQIGVYAHCAAQMLERREGRRYDIASAMYVAFADDRDVAAGLGDASVPAATAVRERAASFADAVARIERGEYAIQPRRTSDCQWCGFAGVCRKEYAPSQDDDAANPV